MDRGEGIVHHQLFGEQNCVLVVIAFPSHEANQHISAQTDFTMIRGRAICDHVAAAYFFPHFHNGMLINTGRLIGTCKFRKMIGMRFVIGILNYNFVCRNLPYETIFLCKYADAGIPSCLAFDTSRNIGCFRSEQRDRLALHVGTHQSTVCIVVVQERNHCSSNRNNLPRRNVNIVHPLRLYALHVSTDAHSNSVISKGAIRIQRLPCLGDHAAIFFIRRKINNLIHHSRHARRVIDATIGCLDETIFIDPSIGCKTANEANVRTFRCLDRADARIVGIMNVANLERCTVTIQAARSQSRQTALMGQLRQGVRLIHELGQL